MVETFFIYYSVGRTMKSAGKGDLKNGSRKKGGEVKGCLCGLVCTEKLNVKQYPMLVLRWGSQWHLVYLLNY